MKAIVILLTAVMFFSGCSSSSGGKANSTNPVSPNGKNVTPGRTHTGSTVTPTTPGVTPYAYGENRFFPVGAIELGFDTSTNGSVYSEGEIRLQSKFETSNCLIPAGTYELLTSIPGIQKSTTVHHYGGVTLSATGPVLFTAVLENSLSRQNPDGEWVMDARLRPQSVGGVTCSNPVLISFGMPAS